MQHKFNFSWWQILLIIVGGLCLVVMIGLVARHIYWQQYYKKHPPYCYNCYENTSFYSKLSDDIELRYVNDCWSCDKLIFNSHTHRLANRTPVRWIMQGEDSLAVAAIAGRRGYINVFTGEQVLPFMYTRAWVFSDGIAAVTDTADNLLFIAPDGKLAIDKSFSYDPAMRYEGYVFHGGHCIMTVGKRYGLIDRTGAWRLGPNYDCICWRGQYWELKTDDNIVLLDTSLNTIVPKQKAIESRIYDNAGWDSGWNILVEIPNKPSKLYSPSGRLLSDKLYHRVESLRYDTDEDGNGGKTSACMYYMNLCGQVGLLDNKGRQLTDALYCDIKALDYNVFQATLTEYPNQSYVLIDAHGKQIK